MSKETRLTLIQWIRAYGKTVAITVLIVFVIRWKVVEPFFIPSSSMAPTLKRLDRVLVSKISIGKPGRWEVIVFRDRENPHRTFVKRIVGLPGETLHIIGGEIFINEQPVKKPERLPSIFYTNAGRWGTAEPITIPEGCYFVLGDNSDSSKDSRVWRQPFVSRRDIVGSALTIIWPPSRIGLIR